MPSIIGNRPLHFELLSEGIAEAERLADKRTRSVGHFSHAQNVDHLARTLRIVVGDVPPPKFSLRLRWSVRLNLNSILTQRAEPGIQLPAESQALFWTEDDISVDEAMNSLRGSYERFVESQSSGFPKHPLFGRLSNRQHEQIQCRHFELHLGMIVE